VQISTDRSGPHSARGRAPVALNISHTVGTATGSRWTRYPRCSMRRRIRGSTSNQHHPKLGMMLIIPSTGSCQVELANLGAALIFARPRWHDRVYSNKGTMAL
jgi:hypothetical protein